MNRIIWIAAFFMINQILFSQITPFLNGRVEKINEKSGMRYVVTYSNDTAYGNYQIINASAIVIEKGVLNNKKHNYISKKTSSDYKVNMPTYISYFKGEVPKDIFQRLVYDANNSLVQDTLEKFYADGKKQTREVFKIYKIDGHYESIYIGNSLFFDSLGNISKTISANVNDNNSYLVITSYIDNLKCTLETQTYYENVESRNKFVKIIKSFNNNGDLIKWDISLSAKGQVISGGAFELNNQK